MTIKNRRKFIYKNRLKHKSLVEHMIQLQYEYDIQMYKLYCKQQLEIAKIKHDYIKQKKENV